MSVVSTQWDIKSLFERYTNIEFANKGRPSTSNGILEYHSNCPKCPGSKDSFIIRPETGQFNHCTRSSGCGWKGDAIDLLTDPLVGMSHQEARDFLGLEQNGDFVPSERTQTAHVGKEQPPNEAWQYTGKLLVERAVHALWNTSEGRMMLDYLHGRGLGDEIIKKKKLGYIPLQKNGKYYESELEQWGLDPAKEVKDKVRIPDCILIPWFDGNTLWRLGVKRLEQQKYIQVLGSGEGLFNVGEIQYDTPAMIVEGEICAMSVEQEAGDLIACVATGSTTRGRLNKWIAELNMASGESSFVLQSFDEDDGKGDAGSEYWIQNLKRCMRWSPLVAKDPNDILRGKFLPPYEGQSLREWVEAGIHIARVEFGQSQAMHPPPIVTPPCKVEVPIRQVSLIEQGIREYGGKLLSHEQAMNRTGQPIKPDFPCFFCKSHPRRKSHWVWTWSPLDGECICVECLSPANWSQRNMVSSTVNNDKNWM
jgi:hypothetical protein